MTSAKKKSSVGARLLAAVIMVPLAVVAALGAWCVAIARAVF